MISSPSSSKISSRAGFSNGTSAKTSLVPRNRISSREFILRTMLCCSARQCDQYNLVRSLIGTWDWQLHITEQKRHKRRLCSSDACFADNGRKETFTSETCVNNVSLLITTALSLILVCTKLKYVLSLVFVEAAVREKNQISLKGMRRAKCRLPM